jgi:aryl-alcohol dehydrogenase-like predicted oxidoreductase
MEIRRIGSLEVSVVGLGCNNFGMRLDFPATEAVIAAALEAGINLLDTADTYGGTKSEEFIGRALGKRRDEVVLATKFGSKLDEERKGAAPAYVRRAVEDSLRRLGTDRIDLYILHWPDPAVPIADTLGALDELVRAGKVREIGCSNVSAEQLREAKAAVKAGAARFVSTESEYSLLHRDPEAGVLAECVNQGMALLPYFPLASGLLTGKYRKGQPLPQGTRITDGGRFSRFLTEERLERVESLARFAESGGHNLLELAFSWLLARKPVTSVIAGATSPAQVKSNAGAAGWKLTADELAEVDRLLSRPV